MSDLFQKLIINIRLRVCKEVVFKEYKSAESQNLKVGIGQRTYHAWKAVFRLYVWSVVRVVWGARGTVRAAVGAGGHVAPDLTELGSNQLKQMQKQQK